MSMERATRQISERTAPSANRIALIIDDKVHGAAIGERIGTIAFLAWGMVRLNFIRSIGTTHQLPDRPS